jgi:formylglycine-generating enzyme required for sulfatase activity
VTDPRGPFFGSRRVVRGGSWFFSAKYSRAAIRYNSSPDLRGGYLGFRLARDAD